MSGRLTDDKDRQSDNSPSGISVHPSGNEIVLIQYVANVENELVFQTKEENGKYYISETFGLFIDNIITVISGIII